MTDVDLPNLDFGTTHGDVFFKRERQPKRRRVRIACRRRPMLNRTSAPSLVRASSFL
jgi:hypothetical protein